MKKMLMLALCMLVFASLAMAQYNGGPIQTGATGGSATAPSQTPVVTPGTTPNNPLGDAYLDPSAKKATGATFPGWFGAVDKLGAHQNGGKGCVGCHAPHSGGAGNGGNNTGTGTPAFDTEHNGKDVLWGQDLGPLYNYQLTGQTYTQWIAGGVDSVKYLNPAQTSGAPDNPTYNTWQMTACAGCAAGDLRKDKLYTSGTVPAGTSIGDQGYEWKVSGGFQVIDTSAPRIIVTASTPGNYNLPGMNQFETRKEEVTGIMMCLSCHDGNIAQGAMMKNASYEQQMGLLPAGAYGNRAIPTLLANDGNATPDYSNDHPIGPDANLGAVGVAGNFYFAAAGCGGLDCLKIKSTATLYQAFADHYGAPNIISNGHGSPVVIVDNAPQKSFVVCTTCHTPHSMNVYKSNSYAPINKDGGSTVYPSYFFIAAPYNPGTNPSANQASSATQFCRQCHFTGAGGSNEGSGIMSVSTKF